MSVTGSWTLHFDWGNTGTYTSVAMALNSDSTFSVNGLPGKYLENQGKIVLRFNSNNAVYGGDDVENAMTGISSTLAGLNGSWYAVRAGSTIAAAAQAPQAHTSEFDAAGSKTNQHSSK